MLIHKPKTDFWYINNSIVSIEINKKKYKFFLKLTFFCSYFFACLFFAIWCTTIRYEPLIVPNSSKFSKCFYFLNPNLWVNFIFIGNYSTNFINASNHSRIEFLFLFYASVICFCLLFFFSSALFLISTFYGNAFYRVIGIFCMIPVVGLFLIKLYVIHHLIFYLHKKIQYQMSTKNVDEFRLFFYKFSSRYIRLCNQDFKQSDILGINKDIHNKHFLIKTKEFLDKYF